MIVRPCLYPSCSWSLTEESDPLAQDPAGVEAAIEAHLDEDHPGWSLPELEELARARQTSELRAAFAVGPQEMFSGGF